MSQSLTGLHVVSFESRLKSETAALIDKHGGRVIIAPALKEVPLQEIPEAKPFAEALCSQQVDILVLMTGVGTTLLINAAIAQRPKADVVLELGRSALVCRGPKPSAALKPFGLRPTILVPEPNTWRDIVDSLDAERPVRGKRVYIQEYGTRNEDLIGALRDRGATVTSLKLYNWSLPDDTAPLKAAILKMVRGQAQIALFTAGRQVDHLLLVAQEIGLAPAVRRALINEMVVASIGPMTTEALEKQGIKPDIVPGHPKLGHLVLAVARRGRITLAEKLERTAQQSGALSSAFRR